MKPLQSKSQSDLDDHPDDEVSAGGSSNTYNTSAKDPADIATEETWGNSLMDHSGVQGLSLKVLLSMMKLLSQNR